MAVKEEVTSTFGRSAAYRYIRRSDKLPAYADLSGLGLDRIFCRVKIFNPTGCGTWWIASFDPNSMVAWGIAEIHTREVGTFSVEELLSFRGRFGLPLERDLHFKPATIGTLLHAGQIR